MLQELDALLRFPFPLRTWMYLPAALPRAALARSLSPRDAPGAVPSNPELRDPEYLGRMLEALRVFADHYFRWEVRGVENLPAEGPALLVGNHNGGIMNTDSGLTLLAVWDRFGPERILHPLAHDFLFFDPVLGQIARRMGILRAGHDQAGAVLRQGRLVLVYPGSDLDACRRFRDRNRIELGGRTGFLELAIRERVPIVPVVSAGTHEQFVVLARGAEFARRIGLKRTLRAEAFPLVLSFPWGLTSGLLPYVPLPAQTTLAFGKPIRFAEAGGDPTPATLSAHYEQVRTEMQALLDTITQGRRWLRGQRRAR